MKRYIRKNNISELRAFNLLDLSGVTVILYTENGFIDSGSITTHYGNGMTFTVDFRVGEMLYQKLRNDDRFDYSYEDGVCTFVKKDGLM